MGLTVNAMFTTESQPLAVVYVLEYVPAVEAVPPHGNTYGTPWQVEAVKLVVKVASILSVMFTTESQPLVVVYVLEYVPAVEAVPPHGNAYGTP